MPTFRQQRPWYTSIINITNLGQTYTPQRQTRLFSSVYNTSYHLAHLCKYIFHNLYYSHTLTNSHIHTKQSLNYRSLDFSLWGWRRHNEKTKIRNWMVEKSSKYDFKVIIKRIFKLFLFIPLYTYKRDRRRYKSDGKTRKKEVSSLFMTLRKRKNTGNWKRKHYIPLCGEFAIENVLDLS